MGPRASRAGEMFIGFKVESPLLGNYLNEIFINAGRKLSHKYAHYFMVYNKENWKQAK